LRESIGRISLITDEVETKKSGRAKSK